MSASGAISLINVLQTTATQTSPDWEVPSAATGAIFVVKVSNSSGFTSGFVPAIQFKDEFSGAYYQANANYTAIAANGTFVYVVYPSAGTTPGTGSGITAITNTTFIPPKGRFVCTRTDGTYDLSVSMTPIALD